MMDTEESERATGLDKRRRQMMVQIPFLVLVALFVGGYVALYIPPENGWFFQLLGMLLPVISLSILLYSMIILFLENWQLLILTAICLILLAIRYLSFQTGSTATQEASEPLVVMTYNAKTSDDGYSEMVRVLDDVDPDIIAIQEAPVVSTPDSVVIGAEQHMFPLLRRFQASIPTLQPDSAHHWVYQPVFTSLNILQTTQTFYQPPARFSTSESSPVTRVELQYDSTRIAVYNVHMRSVGSRVTRPGNGWLSDIEYWYRKFLSFPNDVRFQAEEAKFIRDMLDAEELPFIVCGDLNTTSSNWVYRHLSRGLTDTFSTRGKGFGSTYPSKYPALRIDYILVSRGWDVISADVSSSLLSDHLPVVATVALRKF